MYNYPDFLSMVTPQNRGYNTMWHQADFWYFSSDQGHGYECNFMIKGQNVKIKVEKEA